MSEPLTSSLLAAGLFRPRTRVLQVFTLAGISLLAVTVMGIVTLPRSPALTTFSDIAQCLAALFAAACLFLNARSPRRRIQVFWALLGFGAVLWLAGQLCWTYFEVYLRQPTPNPFIGDVILFVHTVPMIAALAIQPHDHRDDLNVRTGYVDLSLLVIWWVYLYLFLVIPWQYISRDVELYGRSYDSLEGIENLILAVGFAMLAARARGAWWAVYLNLMIAVGIFAAAAYNINVAIDDKRYYTGSIFDIPLVASFIWLGMSGLIANALQPRVEDVGLPPSTESVWPARLSVAAVFSMPLLALWSLWSSLADDAVREFRVGITLIVIVAVAFLMIFRQRLVNRDRQRLLEASQKALEDLKKIQGQMLQSEKLASLGHLAAGAAHEINNPLTGILGYAELLAADPALSDKQHNAAEKIRSLGRRIKDLVTNLLSFARQVPSEKTLLDLNLLLSSALQLCHLDTRGKNVQVKMQTMNGLPPVRGDANQILQVFFNLIDNAMDALEEVGGGVLTIQSSAADAQVRIDFSDTGPGIRSPQQAFDPFYTTKPVGKGTGLGLSICFGIMQEHSGRIECCNLPGGGATFRVCFPQADVETHHPMVKPSAGTSASY